MIGRENVQAALLAIPMELARITNELQAGLQEFHNGNRITGARYVPLTRGNLLNAGPGRLVGWSLRLEGAGPMTVYLRDGRDPSAEAVAVVELGVDLDRGTAWMGPGGVSFGEALWLDAQGVGEVEGAVWLGAVD